MNETQTGWKCPECGRVNAPWVSECPCSVPGCVYTEGGDWKPGPEPQPIFIYDYGR